MMGEAKDRKEDHVAELLGKAYEAELDGYAWVSSLGFRTICREYNGIGPEWAGEKIRDKVTKYLGLFEPAALIHDLRNYKSDGTRYGFNYANFEFLANCRALANAAYPWYSWRRYRARAIAHALFDFVSGPGGWKAWQDCHERNLFLKQQ